MIKCCEWLLAESDNVVQQDAFGNWYIEDSINYTESIIEYCPFCGNKLGEKGCPYSRDRKES